MGTPDVLLRLRSGTARADAFESFDFYVDRIERDVPLADTSRQVRPEAERSELISLYQTP